MDNNIIDQYLAHYSTSYRFEEITVSPGDNSRYHLSVTLLPLTPDKIDVDDLTGTRTEVRYDGTIPLQLDKISLRYLHGDTKSYQGCRYTRTVIRILTGNIRMLYHRRYLTPLHRVNPALVRHDLGPRTSMRSGIITLMAPEVLTMEPYTYYRFLTGTRCLLLVTLWRHHNDDEGPNEVIMEEDDLRTLISPPRPPIIGKPRHD